MAQFQRRITIEAPPHIVFDYWKNPANWLEVWPGLIDVSDVALTADGVGTTYRWVSKIAGRHFRGHSEFVECIPDRRIVAASHGGLEAVFIWTFEPDGNRTRMTASVNYLVPDSLVGKLTEPFIHKVNEYEVEVTLANLMARLEHQSAGPTTEKW